MSDEYQKYIRIKPGEPGYDESSDIDAFGGKPVSLTTGLRFAEDELHKLQKMKSQGYKNTLSELPDDSGEEVESRPIDERITELEKTVSGIEEVIDWVEAKRPGSSKNENGSLVIMEYEKETGKKV